jgi:putative tricarboxylic transport membrane protein
MQTDEADDDASGVATWKVELFVSLCLFALGAVVAFKSFQLGAGWRDDGPGAGYFPFYVGMFICLSSGVIAVRALLPASRVQDVFVTHAQLRLVLTVLLPSIAFVLAVQFLGLYVGSMLFITGFMVWVGHYGWLRSTMIGFVVMALSFLMFEVWFKVPLFKGSLDPLRFLGY